MTMEIDYQSNYTYWKMFLKNAVGTESVEVLAGS